MKVRKYPRGVSDFTDRHGKLRIRGRRAGWPTYYFTHQPPSEAFELELRNWLNSAGSRPEIGLDRSRPGSMSFLIAKYYRSLEFTKLEQSTQATYSGILEKLRGEHGERTIVGFNERT